MLPENDRDDEWARLVGRRNQMRGVRGQRIGGEPQNEAEHFYTCGHCGQAVDKPDLFAVLHHEPAEHEPLPTN